MAIDAFVTAIAAAGLAVGSVAADQGERWSERGLFVFNGIVLDFTRGKLRAGPADEALTDCSDSQWYCARSRSLSLVLPRACVEPKTGTTWTHAGVRTEVLGRSSTAPARYYLADPARPSLVFVYDRSGVGALYWDQLGRTNFAALARSASLDDWMTSARGRLAASQYRSLLTFEMFGNCRNPDRSAGSVTRQ